MKSIENVFYTLVLVIIIIPALCFSCKKENIKPEASSLIVKESSKISAEVTTGIGVAAHLVPGGAIISASTATGASVAAPLVPGGAITPQ